MKSLLLLVLLFAFTFHCAFSASASSASSAFSSADLNGGRGFSWRVGLVDFPTTTNSTEAQALFNRGVAMLHNFWYDEAAIHFKEIRTHDSRHAVRMTPSSSIS